MKCRVCGEDTVSFLNLSTDQLDEPFLDGTLRKQLPELKLRRCSRCRCLWANDARQHDGILNDAYERVAETYFDVQENDPRYIRFYKELEQLMNQHASGKRISMSDAVRVSFCRPSRMNGPSKAWSQALWVRVSRDRKTSTSRMACSTRLTNTRSI